MDILLNTGSFSLASGWFLIAFLILLMGYVAVIGKRRARNLYLLAFSLLFYWKLSGWYVLLLVAVAFNDWMLGRAVVGKEGVRRKWPVAVCVAVDVAVLVFFKASGLFSGLIEVLSGKETLSVGSILIPAGISFLVFQSVSYVVDIYRGRISPVGYFPDYLLMLSFFPKMTLGPLVRNDDFIRQIGRDGIVITREDIGEAAALIARGIIKYCVIARCVGALITAPIFSESAAQAGSTTLLGVYAFAIQIYCDFSGYTDLATGISLLMGFRLPLNFDAPYKSATITEFWRRWHISLSSWLREYLYIPLGGNRKGKIRTYINLILTMFLGGLWHGIGFTFVIWGLLHGIALSLHKLWLSAFPGAHKTGEGMSPLQRMGGILITFHIVLLGWLFFNAADAGQAFSMLGSMFTDFNTGALVSFAKDAAPAVVLMAAGYFMHFLPSSWNAGFSRLCSSGGIVLCVIVIVAAIWIALQAQGMFLSLSDAPGLPIYANF